MTQTTPLYRAMIYFAVATMYFYRDEIKPSTCISAFRRENAEVIKRVFDEGLKYFQYELSHEQMSRAIAAYNAKPDSLKVAA